MKFSNKFLFLKNFINLYKKILNYNLFAMNILNGNLQIVNFYLLINFIGELCAYSYDNNNIYINGGIGLCL